MLYTRSLEFFILLMKATTNIYLFPLPPPPVTAVLLSVSMSLTLIKIKNKNSHIREIMQYLSLSSLFCYYKVLTLAVRWYVLFESGFGLNVNVLHIKG